MNVSVSEGVDRVSSPIHNSVLYGKRDLCTLLRNTCDRLETIGYTDTTKHWQFTWLYVCVTYVLPVTCVCCYGH